MKDLDIYIEIQGEQVKAGEIRAVGNAGSGGSGGSSGRTTAATGASDGADECVFRYSEEYMSGMAVSSGTAGMSGTAVSAGTAGITGMSGRAVRQGRPISISLPFQEEPFTPEQTRNFFSGLLPEGFMRRRVSELAHVGEGDYTEILADLGSECIGAIKAVEPGHAPKAAEYVRLSDDEIASLAGEGVVEASELVMKAHLSLTGASGKVGLYLDPDTKEWYLPVGEAPSTHIVKQSHIRLGGIIANEQLCLMTARKLGITVPDSFIIKMGGSRDSQVLLATERFDRKKMDGEHPISGHIKPFRMHQEDFAQAMGIPAQDKYEAPGDHYLERAFKVLLDHSARPVEDQIKLWKIVIFDFLIGNTDNHIKNISLLYSERLDSCRLAPAYDMLSTSIYEMSTDNMAFSIGGDMSIADITRESFGREAAAVGINEAVAYRQFDRMSASFVKTLTASANDLTELGFANAAEIKDRILETGGIAKI